MKESYIIATDLHLNVHKANRFSYRDECLSVIDYLHNVADKCRTQGSERVHLIPIGDINDVSKSKRSEYTAVQQMIKLLISAFDTTSLLFGNHEITYYANNPIYSYIQSIQHEEVATRYPFLKCESVFNEILTPERIVFENAEIVFRGFRTSTLPAYDKEHNILLCHEDLLSMNGIVRVESLQSFQVTPYIRDISMFDQVYVGHNHTVVEQWSIENTNVFNLGALLRTSITQISDFDRKRYIPVLTVEDNYLMSTHYEEIDLHLRADIVDEASIQIAEEKSVAAEERQHMRAIGRIPDLDVEDPVAASETIVSNLSETHQQIFSSLKRGVMPLWDKLYNV